MPTDYSSIQSDKLLERRLDYAWKYFDSASQKRMQFVNYYVLLVGVLGNAYVLAINQGRFPVAVAVCLFAVVCSVTFMMLDHRMLIFVSQALSVLETLEREVLFPDGDNRLGPTGRTNEQLGLAQDRAGRATSGCSRSWDYQGEAVGTILRDGRGRPLVCRGWNSCGA